MIEIPITLADGVPRKLCYTLGSFRRLRERGVDLLTIADDQIVNFLPDFLWSGLCLDDPTLTPEMVAELVPLADAPRVLEAITAALGAKGA